MFGFSLKEKSEKIIQELFSYSVAPIHAPVFNNILHHAKTTGQNEYSVAFYYMMVMMNTLVTPSEAEEIAGINPNASRDDSQQEEINNFIKTHASTITNNIHLANTPEREIKQMLDEVLSNAGINSGVNSSENVNEGSSSLEKIFKAMDIFKSSLSISMSMVNGTKGFKYISEYQMKCIFGLQFFGICDRLAQSFELDELSVLYVFKKSVSDINEPEPIFSWSENDAQQMVDKIFDVNMDDWARKIITNGFNAVDELMSKNENKDYLPLLKVFDDEALMKQIAAKIIPI